MIFAINDHVVREGTTYPIGMIEDLNGNLSATVRWGVADGREYKQEIPQDQLQLATSGILSPDEVQRKQAEAAGGKLVKEE